MNKEIPITADISSVFPGFEKKRDAYDLENGVKTFPDILEEDFWKVYVEWKSQTLLSTERVYNLYQAARYVAINRIPGDFVECGVLFGGASIIMALFAEQFGLRDRRHYLFDTFSGFQQITPELDYRGRAEYLGPTPGFRHIVERNIERSKLDVERFVIVEGDVKVTLPCRGLDTICLLRLDTDDYATTRHELESLHEMVSPQGVLIVDDYGHYKGARRAVDEYLSKLSSYPLMQRVDYSGRCWIKSSPHV